MVVNVPLAYMFSIPFTLVSEHLFLPAFVLGYWLTNLAGFILLHKGVTGFLDKKNHKGGIVRHLVIASLYTVVIMLMVWLDWIPVPTELINKTS